MGIRSTSNWSGTVIAGCLLGEPAIREDGSYEWDGGVPNGVVDDEGVFTPDSTDLATGLPVKLPMSSVAAITFKQWVQPTGALDAYAVKAVVKDGGRLWVNLTLANTQKPGVSGWRQFSESVSAIFDWVQPAGAHDAYRLGAEVSFGGFNWRNTGSDANVWQPGVFGWVKI